MTTSNLIRRAGLAVRDRTGPPRDYRFSPAVGRWQIELARIARLLSADPDRALAEIDMEIQAVLMAPSPHLRRALTPDRLRFAFSLSLLHDILSIGGRARVVDSEILVSWPDWSAAEGRPAVRRALSLLSGRRLVTKTERKQFERVFAPGLDSEEVARFLASGKFRLALLAGMVAVSKGTHGIVTVIHSLPGWSWPVWICEVCRRLGGGRH